MFEDEYFERPITYEYLDKVTRNKKLILYGAGMFGARTIVLHLSKYEIAYVCDSDSKKWGSEFMGLTVVSPEKLLSEDKNGIIVLIVSSYENEIAGWLIEHNIPYVNSYILTRVNAIFPYDATVLSKNMDKIDKISSLLCDEKSKEILSYVVDKRLGRLTNSNPPPSYITVCDEPHYFNDVFADCLTDSEVYVDAGVFDGDTIIEFIRYAQNRYSHVYGFEPEQVQYAKVASKFSLASEKISLLNVALSNDKGQVSFNNFGVGSQITEDGYSLVNMDKLDNIIKDKVTFIKMDIEGAEYNALLGAENIIRAHKPKLAICLYHKPEDIWELPELILKMVPEYKLYVRNPNHPILYAKL